MLQAQLGLKPDGALGSTTLAAANQYEADLNKFGSPDVPDALAHLTPEEFSAWRHQYDALSTGDTYVAMSWQAGFTRSELAIGPNQISMNLDVLQPSIDNAISQYPSVPKDLLTALLVQESGGQTNAVSGTGALGVAQLTSWVYGDSSKVVTQFGSAVNPLDPAQAILREAQILNGLFSDPVIGASQDYVVAAYNQGPGVVRYAVSQGTNWENYLGYAWNSGEKTWQPTSSTEGKNYVIGVNNILNGKKNIPGYFGTPRH